MPIQRTRADLRQKLDEQVGYLRTSAAAFDDGREEEASRLALSVRVLVHDTGASRALLSQLGVLDDLRFVDTSVKQGVTKQQLADGSTMFRQTMSPGGLAVIHYDGADFAFIPGLNDPYGQRVPFAAWWNQELVPATSTHAAPDVARFDAITRRTLVLEMANTDGGAHIDPTLDEQYAAFLAHEHGVTFTVAGGAAIRGSAARASMRQIAFELLTTLQEAGLVAAAPG